jgi:anti-anti-sigma regulatory factor
MPMTFKIERLVGKQNATVFRVCGRVQIECVNTIKELIDAENTGIVLDLSEVTIADGDAATFFAFCELKGTELKNCPAFLRGWVDQEKARIAQ